MVWDELLVIFHWLQSRVGCNDLSLVLGDWKRCFGCSLSQDSWWCGVLVFRALPGWGRALLWRFLLAHSVLAHSSFMMGFFYCNGFRSLENFWRRRGPF